MKYSFIKKYKKNKNFNRGFTLIELMVATSIFMIIMMIAIGSLIITSDLAKKSNAMNFTMDNLNFAIESMSRSLRMGTNYTCSSYINLAGNPAPSSCANGNTFIAFKPAGEAKTSTYRVGYKLNTGTNTIQRCTTSGCVDIVSPDINIDNLKFFVRGAETGDNIQPSIYMIVKGSVSIKGEVNSFAIQTMIAQRTLE